SLVIPVDTDRNGGFTAASQVVEAADYYVLKRHMTGRLKEAAKGIRGGDIAVAPAELADRRSCDYCAYRAVCGLDIRVPGYGSRILKKRTREEILAELRQVEEARTS
ncbi:MAG: PD-(D/E)XK nuclease family protein, partial [Butyrivibrio sp.]|nr:PD-(D/E)XK nuclease family protein [Butyrivibrio sp.]